MGLSGGGSQDHLWPSWAAHRRQGPAPSGASGRGGGRLGPAVQPRGLGRGWGGRSGERGRHVSHGGAEGGVGGITLPLRPPGFGYRFWRECGRSEPPWGDRPGPTGQALARPGFGSLWKATGRGPGGPICPEERGPAPGPGTDRRTLGCSCPAGLQVAPARRPSGSARAAGSPSVYAAGPKGAPRCSRASDPSGRGQHPPCPVSLGAGLCSGRRPPSSPATPLHAMRLSPPDPLQDTR